MNSQQPPSVDENSLPEHYIEAHTSLVERPLRTLKEGDAFLICDHYGDCDAATESPQGLFYRDTRYLSHFNLAFEHCRPMFLGSAIHNDNAVLSVDLTNADTSGNDQGIPRDLIAILRTKFLWAGACYERLGFRNYDTRPRDFGIQLTFDADFKDLFELRGSSRAARGVKTARRLDERRLQFTYVGLDRVIRHTTLRFEPAPVSLDNRRAAFNLRLAPGERSSIVVSVACGEGVSPEPPDFRIALRDSRRRIRRLRGAGVTIESSNELFDGVMSRSASDLTMLLTDMGDGTYPYAGVPWFSTMFGRDGIITAIFLLWSNPAVARGVLRQLSTLQAQSDDPINDAQPGKILHEVRNGEMANLGEVPFGRYYGSVDSTPLFLLLAGLYFERTGDVEFVKSIWPNVIAALEWCDTYGDVDGDGFIEYNRQTPQGLANQGWKDSNDSIFHADGTLAEGPIALVEVQSYVYAAKRSIAIVARATGSEAFAQALDSQADQLRSNFEKAFWCADIGTYAIALDGKKRRCEVRSSNAGHALFCGIASPDRAASIAQGLGSTSGSSGWGIRTIPSREVRYNPMSYHNGSIWPHDNAIIALGLARYGLKEDAARVFAAMFEAATHQDQWRIPELYCGFNRRRNVGPTAYPVACAPQAWAAAAPFGCLSACLGLQISYRDNLIRFNAPVLPKFLDQVLLRGLTVGSSRLDVRLTRDRETALAEIVSNTGDAKVSVIDR